MEATPETGAGAAQWARVREILDQALRLPAAGRTPYLDQVCGSDASLRGEVDSLLAAAAGSAFFDQPAFDQTALTEAVSSFDSGLSPGRKISHYQIVSKIGEGGMGAVYKAIDSNLGRPAAVKVISRAFISGSDKRRFALEARAASALNHPNIVTIYEYNSEDGLDFIAMEFVDGVPLSNLLNQGKTPLAVLLDYARQVAGGLARAHAAGIVHRDLKPSNIMIASDGVAKVLDFGLARHDTIASGEATLTALTQTGAILGTPSYMSPEQARGETAGRRSDIFSFGVILYEMVCGRRPFQGDDSPATLRQILYKEAPPLGVTAPAGVPDLIAKCLRKNPDERLASMEDAVAMLSHPGPAIAPPATPAISPKPASSPKRASVAIAAALAAMFAASLLSPAVREKLGEVREQLSEKIRERIPATQAAGAVPDSVDGSASELTVRARNLLRRYDKTGYMDRAIALLERALEKDRKFAPAYAALGEAYLRKGHSVTSSDNHWLKLARDSANQAVLANPDLAAAHTILGDVLLEAGESAQAKTEIDRALQLDPLNTSATLSLARFYSKSDPARAEALFRKAATLAAQDDWIPHSEYGGFLYREARYQDAAAEWEQAERAAPDNVFMLRNLGAAYEKLDQFEKSASALQKALEIEPSAAVWNNLGTARFFQGNYAESVAAFEKAVELNPTNYLNWGNLGDAYRWAPGQRNKAGRAYERAIALVRDLIGRDPHDNQLRGRLAVYLARSGDARDARDELAQLASDPDIRPADQFKMALVWEVLGDRESALRALEKAIRGGYSPGEIRNEPELAALRSDVRYQNLIPPAAAPR